MLTENKQASAQPRKRKESGHRMSQSSPTTIVGGYVYPIES